MRVSAGLEVAVEVVEAGEGAEGLAGHKVCALVTGGGYAEYCLAPAGTCLKVPEVFRMAEAAAMPETLFTVWVNLFERGFAADGDWVWSTAEPAASERWPSRLENCSGSG